MSEIVNMLSSPVHPRWRGEQCGQYVNVVFAGGSSPLARGTGWSKIAFMCRSRFIPAGAGNRHELLRSACHQCGSSPLARGTVCVILRYIHAGRFIPAGAGNSGIGAKNRQHRAVHPRWRGEQVRAMSFSLVCLRFIPAGAGNRCASHGETRKPAVHPRWRGEQLAATCGRNCRGGSSPLARGTVTAPTTWPPGHMATWFIPAGAGNR